MKVCIVILLVLFVLNALTDAKPLGYYPEPEDKTDYSALGIAAGGNIIAVAVTAGHINRCNKLLRSPFAGLEEADLRGFKRRTISMPVLGAIQLTYGIYAIKWTQDEWTKSSERPWLYVISATLLFGGALSIFDAIKSHQVVSKFKSRK